MAQVGEVVPSLSPFLVVEVVKFASMAARSMAVAGTSVAVGLV